MDSCSTIDVDEWEEKSKREKKEEGRAARLYVQHSSMTHALQLYLVYYIYGFFIRPSCLRHSSTSMQFIPQDATIVVRTFT